MSHVVACGQNAVAALEVTAKMATSAQRLVNALLAVCFSLLACIVLMMIAVFCCSSLSSSVISPCLEH